MQLGKVIYFSCLVLKRNIDITLCEKIINIRGENHSRSYEYRYTVQDNDTLSPDDTGFLHTIILSVKMKWKNSTRLTNVDFMQINSLHFMVFNILW